MNSFKPSGRPLDLSRLRDLGAGRYFHRLILESFKTHLITYQSQRSVYLLSLVKMDTNIDQITITISTRQTPDNAALKVS